MRFLFFTDWEIFMSSSILVETPDLDPSLTSIAWKYIASELEPSPKLIILDPAGKDLDPSLTSVSWTSVGIDLEPSPIWSWPFWLSITHL